VAEQALEGVGVAAVSQIIDGEGVAEAVDVDADEAGALADLLEQVEQGVTVEGVAKFGDE
jgi:hypothetical protein